MTQILTNQIRTEVRFLLALSGGMAALQTNLQEVMKKANDEVIDLIFRIDRVGLYELEVRQIFSLLLKFSGLEPEVEQLSRSEHPNQAVLDLAQHFLEVTDEEFDRTRTPLNDGQLAHVAPLAMAIEANFRCLSMFGMYLNSLVKRCENDDLLLKAVLVDSAVLRLPSFAKRVSQAQASADKAFLNELAKSVSGAKSRRHIHLDDLRLALAVLDEMVCLEEVSDDELVSFLHDDMDVLGDRTEDPARSIRAQIKQLRRLQAE